MARFDAFATNYQEVLDRNVRIVGYTSDYFAAYKALYIARKVAPPSGKLLDYGCGVGLLSRHLKHRIPGMQIDGFDVSQDSLARVDKDLLSQGVFTSNADEVGRSYDVIVFANVLHHVRPEARQSLILEAGSRLADRGKLVVFEHNPINPLTRWAVSRCPFDEDAILLSTGETRAYLRSGGLRLLGLDYIVFFPSWLGRFRRFEPFLNWCPVGAQYVVVAGKHRE